MKTKLLAATFALALGAAGVVAYVVGDSPTQPAPKTSSSAQHQRLLPLQGGQNFRDLGGYRTGDGRMVRWGLLFRSGAMQHLTAKDFEYLHKLGIRTVCDLRDNNERSKAKTPWPDANMPNVIAGDYTLEDRGIGIPSSTVEWTAERARSIMLEQYKDMLPRFRQEYRRIFSELLAGNAPLAFNCSAGKDRTGVASALILTALGVPRETVMQDYLLSNRYLDRKRLMQAADGEIKLPPDALEVFVTVDRDFLEATFRVMDAHQGGVNGYLRDEMGLGAPEIKKLRDMYTQ